MFQCHIGNKRNLIKSSLIQKVKIFFFFVCVCVCEDPCLMDEDLVHNVNPWCRVGFEVHQVSEIILTAKS